MIDDDLVRRGAAVLADIPEELDDAQARRLVRQLRALGLERTAWLVHGGERHGPTITGLASRELADIAGTVCLACGRYLSNAVLAR